MGGGWEGEGGIHSQQRYPADLRPQSDRSFSLQYYIAMSSHRHTHTDTHTRAHTHTHTHACTHTPTHTHTLTHTHTHAHTHAPTHTHSHSNGAESEQSYSLHVICAPTIFIMCDKEVIERYEVFIMCYRIYMMCYRMFIMCNK